MQVIPHHLPISMWHLWLLFLNLCYGDDSWRGTLILCSDKFACFRIKSIDTLLLWLTFLIHVLTSCPCNGRWLLTFHFSVINRVSFQCQWACASLRRHIGIWLLICVLRVILFGWDNVDFLYRWMLSFWRFVSTRTLGTLARRRHRL